MRCQTGARCGIVARRFWSIPIPQCAGMPSRCSLAMDVAPYEWGLALPPEERVRHEAAIARRLDDPIPNVAKEHEAPQHLIMHPEQRRHRRRLARADGSRLLSCNPLIGAVSERRGTQQSQQIEEDACSPTAGTSRTRRPRSRTSSSRAATSSGCVSRVTPSSRGRASSTPGGGRSRRRPA
jgi:hypothetical protein